jgi:D-alanyl-D-alanine carboxypeptidase/D-alanyl-D-alanine-endopeptidase (penicillin-binding protein 4)
MRSPTPSTCLLPACLLPACLLLACLLLACLHGSRLFAQPAPPAAPAAFCDQIKALAADPTVAAAHWGVFVTKLDGTPLCSLNPNQLFRPASNNKLFTGAAALGLLGPDYRLDTRVVAEGDLGAGVLHGNLAILGGGDANFGAHDIPFLPPAQRPKTSTPESPSIADIEELATAIVAKGIRSIDGNIIGDDSYYAFEPYPRGWGTDDLNAGYGAPVSALTVHDSLVYLTVAPGDTAQGEAKVTAVPDAAYYKLENSVFGSGKASTAGCSAQIGIERGVGSRTVALFGEIAATARPCVFEMAINDPAEYAAVALKAALERRGVRIEGVAAARHAELLRTGPAIRPQPQIDKMLNARMTSPDGIPIPPFQCTQDPTAVADGRRLPQGQVTVAAHSSPTLAEDLLFTQKESQNLHAEMMMRNLGAAYSCEHSQSAGLAVVRAYLLHAGISPDDIVLYDGSGLSGQDLVTPRALAQILAYASTQRWFPTFKASLPIAGVDGTLSNRFTAPNSKLAGRVIAKTGTLGETRDLSGYLTSDSGQTLVFSILVDNHTPRTTDDRTIMDRMVELIAAQN